MNIAPFAIEEYFALYEFQVPHLLCASDCEALTVAELLVLAGRPLTDLGSLHLGYTESQGHPALRQAIAGQYAQVPPEAVVFLGAPEEGIYLAMQTLLEPEDEVIVLLPAYDSLRNVAAHICGPGRVKPWPLTPAGQGWQLDLAQLHRLITPQTRLLIVNFPHNPTGFLPTLAELQAIIEIARQHNLWLFCDEIYRGLELPGRDTLPSAADLYERSLVLAGLSKVHGLPGLRAGWLIIHDEALRQQFINWKHYTTICAAAPTEFLAQAALAAHPQLVARSRRIINDNLAAANAFFARWPDLFVWRPQQAGSVALVGVNQPSATAFCRQLIDEAGVLLLPGPYLGYDDRHVRLGTGRVNFPAALAHLEAYLQTWPGG